MLKSIKIDKYKDGYNASNLNCIDIPIAGAAGSYNYDNYFFYCFYYCLFKNWTDTRNKSWLEFRNDILDKMGLVIKANQVESNSQLLTLIREKIESQCPVIMVVKYNSVFYCGQYLNKENNMQHGFIVSEYDSERPIFILREFSHFVELNDDFNFKGHVLLRFQIREDMISDIWKRTNEKYKIEDSVHYNKIYSIEKNRETQIKKYLDLVNDFLSMDIFAKNNLIDVIRNFNKDIDKMKNNLYVEFLRRELCNPITVLFGGFDKAFETFSLTQEQREKFEHFKDKYKKFRHLLFSKLHVSALREKLLNDNKMNGLIEETLSLDKELFSIINELYEYDKHNSTLNLHEFTIKKETNYALGAKVSADSEYNPNPDVHLKASQVVNGKWDDWHDMWISTNLRASHWLKVDLGQPKNVYKFVIRHYNIVGYITTSFKVQGSHDGNGWEDLVIVENNDFSITTHEIRPSTYRYFRLYITCPALYDFHARIYEFEVWGVSE